MVSYYVKVVFLQQHVVYLGVTVNKFGPSFLFRRRDSRDLFRKYN